MARVIVCDSHSAIQAALRKRIGGIADLEVVAVAGSVDELHQLLEQQGADVLILELMLPESVGLELVRRLRSDYPGLRIVVYTMYDEAVYAERTIRAGASAYVMKKHGTRSVMRAVRAVLSQEIYVSRRIASRLRECPDEDAPLAPLHPTNSLTDQEMAVFQLIGQGRTVDAVADQLSLSKQDVRNLQSRILDKLDLESVADLMRYAGRIVHQ